MHSHDSKPQGRKKPTFQTQKQPLASALRIGARPGAKKVHSRVEAGREAQKRPGPKDGKPGAPESGSGRQGNSTDTQTHRNPKKTLNNPGKRSKERREG